MSRPRRENKRVYELSVSCQSCGGNNWPIVDGSSTLQKVKTWSFVVFVESVAFGLIASVQYGNTYCKESFNDPRNRFIDYIYYAEKQ